MCIILPHSIALYGVQRSRYTHTYHSNNEECEYEWKNIYCIVPFVFTLFAKYAYMCTDLLVAAHIVHAYHWFLSIALYDALPCMVYSDRNTHIHTYTLFD